MAKSDNLKFNLKPFTPEMHELLKGQSLYCFYYTIYKMIALNMFKWENLPSTMDADFLERTLYTHGKSAVINVDTLGWINTKCTARQNLNLYDYSKSYDCYSNVERYGEFDLGSDNFFLLKNNCLMYPTKLIISLYAYKLFKVDCEIETNISLQKYSAIIECEDKEKMTIQNLIDKWYNNTPLVIGNSSLNLDSKLKTLNFNVPYIADKLYQHKNKVMSELLTFLGKNNVDTEKKERLITDEVNANNDLIVGNMIMWYSSRKQFCEEFNNKTGLDINVEINANIVDYVDSLYNDINIGGDDNG